MMPAVRHVRARIATAVVLLAAIVRAATGKAPDATEAKPMPVQAERLVLPEQKLPPEPRLEIDAPANLARLRAEEDVKLTTYGWVDRPAGVVRIPIDRAINRMLEREKKK